MRSPISKSRPLPVPTGRAARLVGLGGMASGIAGGMLAVGMRQLATGTRPDMAGLLMTPANAARVTDQLARMRGAAMKVGQLISMDGGDMLPPELADILARLRADADYMPPKQLRDVLDAAWGRGWMRRFARFDVRPVAAASIGQVHRASLPCGRDLAIKVQYPGVAASIDSDVRNVGALVRLSGLLPKGLDIAPLLEEAKVQLRQEADYTREAAQMQRFGALLSGAEALRVPEFCAELSGPTVLAMEFLPGHPIETADHADAAVRDRVAQQLLDLVLRELFTFAAMQTDPNFANFRWCPETGQIALLDFGAVRDIPAWVSAGYRDLLVAGLDADQDRQRQAAMQLGFLTEDMPRHQQALVLEMIALAFGALAGDGRFDFSDPVLGQRMAQAGMQMASDRSFVHIPPIETLFVQRKLAGMGLLLRRLRARVDLRATVAPYLS